MAVRSSGITFKQPPASGLGSKMRRTAAALSVLIALLLLPGCAIRRKVEAYQARATAACEAHHTPEQCKPLGPSCLPQGNCN